MSRFFLDDSQAPGAYVLYQTNTGRRRGNPTLVLSLSAEQAEGVFSLLLKALADSKVISASNYPYEGISKPFATTEDPEKYSGLINENLEEGAADVFNKEEAEEVEKTSKPATKKRTARKPSPAKNGNKD